MGMWAASASIGNILGSFVSDFGGKFDFSLILITPAMFSLLQGIVSFRSAIAHPSLVKELNEKHVESLEMTSVEHSIQRGDDSNRPVDKGALGIKRALLIPGVLPYSFAYACTKSVNYTLFFWLPTYLKEQFHASEDTSDLLPDVYDGAGIFGTLKNGLK